MEKPKQLPSGSWRQRYTGPDGRRRSTTDTSARKVQKKAALELAELEKVFTGEKAPETATTQFDTFAEEWLHSRRPGTPDGYAVTSYPKRLNHLSALNEVFGDKAIERISSAEVRRWWNSLADTPSQRSSLYWLLHMILEVAIDDELIQRNPCRVKGASKKPTKKRPTFGDADMEKIHEAATDEMKPLMLVLMGTGLRIGEMLALNWTDIEFLESNLDVTKHLTPFGVQPGTKTGPEHTRSIALPAWVQAALEGMYKEGSGDGPVFLDHRGGRLSIDSAERRFRVIRERAGMPDMHLHDLRHVALTNYARQPGVTLKDVMQFGGHLSERVAMNYQHASTERAQKFAKESVAPRWISA